MRLPARAVFAAGRATRHLLFAVHVDDDENPTLLRARAPYQRWSLDEAPPRLVALGDYTAGFACVDGPGSTTVQVALRSLTVSRDWQEI
ncbi:hypothetical protein ACFWMG_07450 [Streptomyces sp. NPDC127074]|uniref:hypothetical protein n=1 Tax=Streptomyces sp. NPDC127074 TaxID=3347130 RepID=UPI0036686248